MTASLLAAALLAAMMVYAVIALHDVIRAVCKALRPAWLWFSGLPMDGQSRTNATWLQPSHGPRPVLHNSGHAIWWHHLPRLYRAGIRTGSTAAAAAVLYGLATALVLTLACLATAAVLLLALAAWNLAYRVRHWTHERHHVRPLERTLMAKLPTPPESVEVILEGEVVKSVAIDWPAEAEIGAAEQQIALEAVTTRLPIEAPDPAWKLKGRSRSVVFTQSEPPPSYVEWNDRIAAAIRAAAPNELVFGVGKRDAIVTAKYSDSPHIAIPGGSGGGKSNLAAFLLLQEMIRGSLIINLDPKWISHLWLQDLPNVINAHDPADLHLALCWLGGELVRRTKAAYYSAGGTGRVRGSVGNRIIVLAEELNYGMPGIKALWCEMRAQDKTLPKQSQAVAALSALSCAGRASDIHEWLIAQLLTVDSTGVKDSTIRTNAGTKAMLRHDKPGWDMAVGKQVPMPAPSRIQGRIQLVTGGEPPRETQVPYLHLDDPDEAVAEEAVRWARDLAVSGTVAQIPSGPQGVPPQLWPASVLQQQQPAIEAGQGGLSNMTGADVPVTGAVVVTLAEAVDRGIIGPTIQAVRKARSREDGFPEPVGERPGAGRPALLYDASDLHAWNRRRSDDRKVPA